MAEVSSTPAAASTHAPRRVEKPRTLRLYHYVAAFIAFLVLRFVSWTWRLRLDDPGDALRSSGPVILCLWHNRLALCTRMWERFGRVRIRSAGVVALISASHDGGVLAQVLGYFGIEAVRGSSSRRGAQALLELARWTRRGYTITITPDGPRGPSYKIDDGILALAQLSGLPVVPVSTFVRRKFQLRSWDKFQIPWPLARCEVRVGQPLTVPREISDEQRAALKDELRARMMALTRD